MTSTNNSTCPNCLSPNQNSKFCTSCGFCLTVVQKSYQEPKAVIQKKKVNYTTWIVGGLVIILVFFGFGNFLGNKPSGYSSNIDIEPTKIVSSSNSNLIKNTNTNDTGSKIKEPELLTYVNFDPSTKRQFLLNIRDKPCGDIIGTAKLFENGSRTETKTDQTNTCSTGNSNWSKVKWDSGIEGWSTSDALQVYKLENTKKPLKLFLECTYDRNNQCSDNSIRIQNNEITKTITLNINSTIIDYGIVGNKQIFFELAQGFGTRKGTTSLKVHLYDLLTGKFEKDYDDLEFSLFFGLPVECQNNTPKCSGFNISKDEFTNRKIINQYLTMLGDYNSLQNKIKPSGINFNIEYLTMDLNVFK